MRPSISRFVQIRHLRYHLRVWNPEGQKLFVALHGIRDASATFQFLVDALPADWCIVAPDWRGHGKTEWDKEEYFFQHYLSDLDLLLDAITPDAPARIIGHSMGGNVSMVYAGIKPQRVARIAALDGFGLYDDDPKTFPARLRRWLTQRHALVPHRGYPDISEMAKRLRAGNARLDEARALFLAKELAVELPNGTWRWAFDPQHRVIHPYLYHFPEWGAAFEGITAPALWIGSDRAAPPNLTQTLIAERLKLLKHGRYVHIPETGHNLQHDAPERVAALLIGFFDKL